MSKSEGAFRTISEVSDWLDTPTHVLRFWESKFPQIKPVKRAGGRRYYRPEDMALLGGIKTLLHDQGLTIKGVQKLLRDQGNKAVVGLAPNDLPEVGDISEPHKVEPAMLSAPLSPVLPTLPHVVPTAPAFLRSLARVDRRPNTARAARIVPLLAQLGAIADRMARL